MIVGCKECKTAHQVRKATPIAGRADHLAFCPKCKIFTPHETKLTATAETKINPQL